MTESEQRTLEVLKGLDSNLTAISEGQHADKNFVHASHSLKWIIKSLDKLAISTFVKQHENELENGNVIIELINSNVFDVQQYN